MELLVPGCSEQDMDSCCRHPGSPADDGVGSGGRLGQDYLPIAVKQYTNGDQVEYQESLNPAWHPEHVPFVLESRIDLMKDQR